MILDILHFLVFGPASAGEVSYAVAPLVAAAGISGGTKLLSSILGGIGKSKKKKKAMEFLLQALQQARANRPIQARNIAGVENIQNRFQNSLRGLGRERTGPNLAGLFAAGASNPFQAQPGALPPVSFDPSGQAPGAATPAAQPQPAAPLPTGGQANIEDLLASLAGGQGRGDTLL